VEDPRAGTKQAILIEMLRSLEGATIEEIMSRHRMAVAHGAAPSPAHLRRSSA